MNIKRISWVLAAAFAVLISGTVQVAWAAMDAYMVIKGEKQGMIGSQSSGAGAGKIEISDFSFGTDAPASTATGKTATPSRDAASGQTTGKRMHGTITIIKEVDKATPLLMKAMSTNEVLTSVDIMFTHPGAKGPEVFKTMHLTNAMITSIKPAAGGKSEEITFTAETQNIETTTVKGGKTGIDDWMSQK